MNPPRAYKAVTDKWLDDTVRIIVRRITEELHKRSTQPSTPDRSISPQMFAVIDENTEKFCNTKKGFLYKAAEGFVVEFLRQTEDNIPDLNELASKLSAKEKHEESFAGTYHSAAVVKWLFEQKITASEEAKIHDIKNILGVIIFKSKESFIPQYETFTGLAAQASIKRRTDEILDRAIKVIDARKIER